jgi:uncharacterized RDD family membrane protein YckC
MEPTSYSSVPVTREKASPITRFVAIFIDGLLGYIPVFVFAMVSASLATLGYLVFLAYYFTRDSLPFLNGQSIGKKLMGIKVVREDTGANIIGDYGAGIVRTVPQVIPLLNLVDALMIFRDTSKRFGDDWAKTIVVKA